MSWEGRGSGSGSEWYLPVISPDPDKASILAVIMEESRESMEGMRLAISEFWIRLFRYEECCIAETNGATS